MKLILLTFLTLSVSAADIPNIKLLEKYCFDCHADGVNKGDIDFDVLLKQKHGYKEWSKVWEVIEKEQMPPSDKKQPTAMERDRILIGLESKVFKIDRKKSYARPIELFRLSNKQFANSLRHTFGYWSEISRLLPLDPTAAGFNNIGSSMNLSPLLFERYQDIAVKSTRDMFLKDSGDKHAKRSGDSWMKKLGKGEEKKVHDLLFGVMRKAYRRMPTEPEMAKILNIFKQVKKRSSSNRTALMEAFRAIMLSPAHIFRTELFGKSGQKGDLVELDEFALASRMAFFLWNSPPDDYLLNLAQKKELRKKMPEVLARMIKSGNFKNFSESFGQQWLNIQFLENNVPNKRMFDFERDLLHRMKTETSMFFNYLFKENRHIDEFFTSKVSFVNGELAHRYGLKKPERKSRKFEKVTFPENSYRAGILSHPSILIVSSDPDRTSPVKRGLWVLESILGMPPPPAPANIPGIEEAKKSNKKKNLSFKELLAIHRADKRCASCHAMMDPLGLAMENFDASGRWREKENGTKIVMDEEWRGNKLKTFADLQKMIAVKYRDKFLKCMVEKMMTYALARELEMEDSISLNRIVAKIKHKDAKFQDALLEVIRSAPFQYRLSGEHDE